MHNYFPGEVLLCFILFIHLFLNAWGPGYDGYVASMEF